MEFRHPAAARAQPGTRFDLLRIEGHTPSHQQEHKPAFTLGHCWRHPPPAIRRIRQYFLRRECWKFHLQFTASEGGETLQRWTQPAVHLRLGTRSEEHTSELQSHVNLVCRLLLEKKKKNTKTLPH